MKTNRNIPGCIARHILYSLLWLASYPVLFAAESYKVETVPNIRLTDRYNHVSNPDGIISPEDVAQINRLLNGLEDSLSIEVAVVALTSIGDEDISTFANELFKHWGIGKKGEDNGLLMLLVTDQRLIKFETGYGLEGIFPDAISYRIQQQYMIPDLKANKFSAGMLKGVEGVTDYFLRSDYEGRGSAYNTAPSYLTSEDFYGLLKVYLALSLLVAIWFIWRIATIKRRHPEYNSIQVLQDADNTFKRIGCIITLFFLSGIIILGIWYFFYRQLLKKRARICPNCGRNHFHLLPPSEGNSLLNAREQVENRLGSVDHTVYRCDDCHYVYKNAEDVPNTPYSRCPRCGTKALVSTGTHIIQQPTYSSNGLAEETYVCKMCNYTDHHKKVLNRLRRGSLAGGIGGAIGGGMIGRGLGGGGGFGGGLGGGSWGGGGSGGGGSIGRF